MGKLNLQWLLTIILLILIGCTSSITYIKVDQDYEVYKMSRSHALEGGEFNLKLFLIPQAIRHSNGKIYYTLTIKEEAFEEYFFDIRSDRGLSLVVDDVKYVFKDESPSFHEMSILNMNRGIITPKSRHQTNNGPFIEQASYAVTLEIIEKIAHANKVDVIIFGCDNRFEEKHFVPIHFSRFREFVTYARINFEI